MNFAVAHAIEWFMLHSMDLGCTRITDADATYVEQRGIQHIRDTNKRDGSLAKLALHLTCNQEILGANPRRASIVWCVSREATLARE